MNSTKIKELQSTAWDIRLTGLKMVKNARSGHIGGAFSLSEIMSVLYFDKMNIRTEDPRWEDRDRLVLSKGHATVALYPSLAIRGFFPLELLDTFRKAEGRLSGHVEMKYVPGVDMSTGSLGQGLSAAVGMALSGKQMGKNYYTYAILGDGEIQEGQIWEALMYSSFKGLDNLIIILDSNKVQLDGTVDKILNTGDLKAKFESFGLHTITIDGHSIKEISEAIDEAKARPGKPHMIIANTIKGRGVSFMEGKCQWHGKTPNDDEFDQAFRDLELEKMEA
ncbi:MAG: transketolase [Ruminiclostridium sp.]